MGDLKCKRTRKQQETTFLIHSTLALSLTRAQCQVCPEQKGDPAHSYKDDLNGLELKKQKVDTKDLSYLKDVSKLSQRKCSQQGYWNCSEAHQPQPLGSQHHSLCLARIIPATQNHWLLQPAMASKSCYMQTRSPPYCQKGKCEVSSESYKDQFQRPYLNVPSLTFKQWKWTFTHRFSQVKISLLFNPAT